MGIRVGSYDIATVLQVLRGCGFLMAVVVRRLLILPLIALYFASAFCGEGLHSIVCEHQSHAKAEPCGSHAHEGDCPSHEHGCGWHADHAGPVHDEQACAVCQFLAKAQLTAATNQLAAGRPALSPLAARAPVAPVARPAASYCPRGPPAFSA
jgi:hypothetical protein